MAAKLTVTLTCLEEWKDGIVYGTEVTFKAVQSGSVLIEDTVLGKITAPYRRSYDVEAGPGDIVIEHNRPDLHYLSITASLEG
ncbi:TPA: hypothetical protein ON596_002950 [Citrobacter freundii]|uniref:hypothetical protein n=1 Tax=Citrobacter portucalensis TaxID=1639133 RepID=UPI0015E917BD|nr:hypothetical protein [Escherichia coli]ELO5434970.1 hypothetical protein [Citrobacter freundii]MDT7190512.1 hypothetical protein [Citrobacter freundii]MDT7208640.1 hypothetical protein [Citrobacter freundii]MDX7262930.1 hypothetical protein [Citrobacter freundii]